MHLLGFELTVVSIMVPPLVLTLGSAYSIHILNQYYREAKVKGEDRSWIAHSVGNINRTILLAALTTIIGFSSLASANLSQIKEFGLSTSIGIVYCALLSLFFFPAILRLLPPPREAERDRVLKGIITRFTVFLRTWNAETKALMMEPEFKQLMRKIGGMVETKLNVGSQRVIWGRSLALLYISETLCRDQVFSVAVSLFFIFMVTAVGFRSLPLGALTLIPMLTGIMLNFIIMVLLPLPFDVVTVMFFSVAIGVGIDDSIHLIIRYRRQIRIYAGKVDKAVVLSHTLKATGRPILLTSGSLVAGLLVLCFSHFLPILYFGILVSLALVTTTAGALVILPALLSFGKR
jgi:predicted RND superfamily exporter protein